MTFLTEVTFSYPLRFFATLRMAGGKGLAMTVMVISSRKMSLRGLSRTFARELNEAISLCVNFASNKPPAGLEPAGG